VKLQSWAQTSTGKVRAQNQDSYYTNDQLGIWLIADGMGGHAGGGVASRTISTELPRFIQQGIAVKDAIHQCHQLLHQRGQSQTDCQYMGSTLVLGLWRKHVLNIYWVGDSRAYIINSQGIKKLTKDHSVVQKLLDLGLVSPDSAKAHPKKHILTQCLGGGSNTAPEVGAVSLSLAENDLILLCSDGLYEELSEDQIHAIVQAATDKKEAVKLLVKLAEKHGGKDNITATVIYPEMSGFTRHKHLFSKIKAWFGSK
jgi:protein phosphatase